MPSRLEHSISHCEFILAFATGLERGETERKRRASDNEPGASFQD